MTRPRTPLPLLLLAALALFAAPGCDTSKQQILAADESQVQLRSIQTRAFDATDKRQMLRTVIATLQDLNFVIDNADEDIGVVTATKLDGYQLRISVTVRPRGQTQLLVRASATYGLSAVTDPEPYQNFFAALEKALFLTAHQVD
jgi:hypothetical protein